MSKFLLTSILLAWTTGALSSASFYSEQYHTVQEVELYEVTTDLDGEEVETLKQRQRLPSELEKMTQVNRRSKADLGQILMATQQLIAIGKEIYKIIDAGKPVLNIESAPISVLPKDMKGQALDPFTLTEWSAPRAKKYRVVAKNYLGMRPVAFEFMLIYSYGGKYEDKGAYITGAQIKPTSVEVSWGYELDASFSVQSIVNQGSAQDPVAGAVLNIDYKIKTLMKESRQSRAFFINGLGESTAY